MTRSLEVFLAALGLLAFLPILSFIAALVKLYDGGDVFYRGRRVGKGGKLFEVYKFRTMVPNADKSGAAITASGDMRITPLGRVLRHYKLDELPQLVNVLKGEMSFVGARPEDPRYVALYNEEQKQVLAFRPGITSPASLHYRAEESLLTGSDWLQQYVNVILPRKLAMDLLYLQRRDPFTDMVIILRTLGGMFK